MAIDDGMESRALEMMLRWSTVHHWYVSWTCHQGYVWIYHSFGYLPDECL